LPTNASQWSDVIKVATPTLGGTVSQFDAAPWINGGDDIDIFVGGNNDVAFTGSLAVNQIRVDMTAGAIFSAMTATHCNQGI
jgi:hypothetical protein